MKHAKRLLNTVMATLVVLGAAAGAMPLASAQEYGAKEKSAEPMSDTWITTKVKTDLLATPDVSGLAIDVETKNGTVMLKGAVESKAQIDKAVMVTKKIDGVKKVDSSGLTVKPKK
jgi:hyperosmotically inducible periplasmic protein